MPSERTPLLTTVRVGPPRLRYSRHNVCRRFCTIAFSSILIWFLLAVFVTLLVDPASREHYPRHDRHHHGKHEVDGWSWPPCPGRKVTDEQLEKILLETPDSNQAREWSKYYTAGAHMAGQNYSQVLWTKEKWEEFGVKSQIVPYDAYLNRPVDHRLALLRKSEDKDAPGWEVAFEASLKEDVLEDDPTTGSSNSIPVFHGYSASGNVTAPVVWVNYGTYQDYEDLLRANVSLEGKIAIARYGGIFRGLKLKRAEELGMVGAILYSDPGDDLGITEENGYKPYPEGPARAPSSVQRGSVEYLSQLPGDPTTPGYPSKPGVPRESTEGVLPTIPSLPISYKEALPILKALNGHGPKASDLNKYWNRNLGLGYKGVHYNIGPTPDDVVVNLYNDQEYIITPIWNVVGIINGTIPDEVIIVGNHRDAWIVGGASDPNSGSAVVNEVIRSFGAAVKQGWKPLRTIVFASWDGEEYGLVGSTEWVEEYLPWLSAANVAYLNVDVGVGGACFGAHAAPLLNSVIREVAAQLQSPNQTIPGQTVADLWDGKIGTMGSGSDFTAFQDYAGIPSLDVRFEGCKTDETVYHYHSNYDSFHWMEKYGDPGFVYHRAMAQVLGLLTAKLADSLIIPFSAREYADALGEYVKKAQDALHQADSAAEKKVEDLSEAEISAIRAQTADPSSADEMAALSVFADEQAQFDRLYRAVSDLASAATALDERARELLRRAADHIPWWRWPARLRLGFQIRRANTQYKLLERAFLHPDGLDGRPWFKHQVFAPGLWTGYAGAVFPGLRESIDARDVARFAKWIDIAESGIKKATESLEGKRGH